MTHERVRAFGAGMAVVVLAWVATELVKDHRANWVKDTVRFVELGAPTPVVMGCTVGDEEALRKAGLLPPLPRAP